MRAVVYGDSHVVVYLSKRNLLELLAKVEKKENGEFTYATFMRGNLSITAELDPDHYDGNPQIPAALFKEPQKA